ncbi:hypothetical protein ACI6PS_10475 [Flavobacterium sp. PLA-1-15]|uniref:hypothetical protein n=1 Tax=Flavobacterium sp. PLA-1-15 TaxID=3380533 RepID=UPI003B7A8B1A
MEENLDDSGLDDYSKQKYEESVVELETEKSLKIKWRKEIMENTAIQQYFEKFHDTSVESFIKGYLSKKYLAFRYRDMYSRKLEKIRTKWIDEATEHLEPILQKKLFDLQCLWRAEQIELEGVEIAFDFDVMQNDIFNCSLVDITQEDIALYQSFLTSGQGDLYCNNFHEWQDYDSLTQDDEEYVSLPEWYLFHNLRTGNDRLLLLPNIRGKKENLYADLARKKKWEEVESTHPVREIKPFISEYDEETMAFFVNTFENAEHKKNILNYKEYNDRTSDEYNIEEIVGYMSEIEDYIPIESHYDYREAIVLAYNKYFFGKVSEHLPLAYEQYLFNKSMNFGKERSEHYKFYLDLRLSCYNRILDGRELNGEPRDLNF